MSEFLSLGMTLYHKTNKTKCIIKDLDEKNITITLSQPLANQNELKLPITHMGKWLFYYENEIELSIYDLTKMPKYYSLNKKFISDAKDIEIRQQKIRKEREQKIAIRASIEEEKITIEENKIAIDEEKRAIEKEKRDIEEDKRAFQDKRATEKDKRNFQNIRRKTAEEITGEIEEKRRSNEKIRRIIEENNRVIEEDKRAYYERRTIEEKRIAFEKEKRAIEEKRIAFEEDRKYTEILKIKKILSYRKIEYLLHFTRIENLDSIMKNGIVPVSFQDSKSVSSIHNDYDRFDSQLNFTSFSLGHPNYKLFFYFRKNKYPLARWVVLLIDCSILFSPSSVVYFCDTNAARVMPRTKNYNELCTGDSLKKMFSETVIVNDKRMIYRKDLNIYDYYTTDPQAEILVSEVIDKKFIKSIYFENENDLNDFLTEYNPLYKSECIIKTNFFGPRNDYRFWGKEE